MKINLNKKKIAYCVTALPNDYSKEEMEKYFDFEFYEDHGLYSKSWTSSLDAAIERKRKLELRDQRVSQKYNREINTKWQIIKVDTSTKFEEVE